MYKTTAVYLHWEFLGIEARQIYDWTWWQWSEHRTLGSRSTIEDDARSHGMLLSPTIAGADALGAAVGLAWNVHVLRALTFGAVEL